jgi:hypothetical protein
VATLTQALNDLFQRWRNSYGEGAVGFAEDGIIDEEAWKASSRKVLFLMKETNALTGDLRQAVSSRPGRVTGYWAYGIQHFSPGRIPSFFDATKGYKEACVASSIVNLKKCTGTSIANMEEVERVSHNDVNLIAEELKIIQPDVVVCCGTFGIAKNLWPEMRPIGDDGRCFELGDAIWIDYYHPSARVRHDVMYYGLLGLYHSVAR